MINENNCTYLFVGNVTNGYADNADVDISTMPAGSVVLVKLDQTTVKAEEGAIAGTTPFQLINKLSDGTIVRSPEFRLENWVSAGKAVYAPPVEQVSYLGYDGTTVNGLGTITLGNSYIVGLWLNHTKGDYSQQGEVKHISAYATDTLQATIVKNLMESHLKNFSPIREKHPSIICDRIARTTSVAALTVGTDTDMAANKGLVYLTHGSKNVLGKSITIGSGAAVVAAADIGTDVTSGTTVFNIPSYNGRTFTFSADAVGTGAGYHTVIIGTHILTVADAGTDAQNAAAIAAAINLATNSISTVASASAAGAVVTITYKEGFYGLPPIVLHKDADADGDYDGVNAVTITSGDAVAVKYVAGETFTDDGTEDFDLDEPWQGPTGYVYAAGTTEATGFGVATLDAANAWGLKFTGIAQPFSPQADYPVQVNFDVLTDSFGSYGTEYKGVKPFPGHGTYAQLAEREAYTQGNDNWYRNSMYPSVDYRREILPTNTYDVITVNFKNSYTSAASGVTVTSPWTAVIAIKNGLSYDTLDTAFGV